MHPWAFRARFRRAAFGWKGSKLAIERIHEALTEIRAVARQDSTTAAEGAVLFLEKLSPALNQIDSSSGALGNATYAAVRELVPIISSAPVATTVRKKWLDRLFEAIQEDDPPYIEHLGDHWGDLCATTELASVWADQLLPTQRNVLHERKRGTYSRQIEDGDNCTSPLHFASAASISSDRAAPSRRPLMIESRIVEAACGECQFAMPGTGCDLAVRIDGEDYFVDGTGIDDHGDAHANEGLCNAVRKARVSGEVRDGRFVATAFELLPQDDLIQD